jgi:hypothetical protein
MTFGWTRKTMTHWAYDDSRIKNVEMSNQRKVQQGNPADVLQPPLIFVLMEQQKRKKVNRHVLRAR